MKGELEDFEAFLEKDFQALNFANDLIIGTNGNQTAELDINTPIKKLTFDIQECQKRMTSIAGNNHEVLVSNLSNIELTKSILNQKINPGVSQINQKFNRIKSEIIEPYEESLKLNNALKKIHTTLDLLRGSSFFIILIQQVSMLEVSINAENIKDLPKLARLHLQLQELYENANKNHTKDSNILSVKLIRDYYPIHVSKKSTIMEQAIQVMSNEFNHHSTFTEKNANLENHMIAYYLLDNTSFYQTFDKVVLNKQVQTALTQLSRTLQTPRNFTSILSEVKQTSEEYFNQLAKILSLWEVSRNSNESSRTFDDIITSNYRNKLSLIFYERLSNKFQRAISATLERGGPISKNLKIYYVGLTKIVSEIYSLNIVERDLLLAALEIIDK